MANGDATVARLWLWARKARVTDWEDTWAYRAGVYSAGAMNREFGEFNGSYVTLGSVGYDFGKALGVKKALLRADYVYNDPNEGSTATRNFEQIGSLVFQLEAERAGFSSGEKVRAGIQSLSGRRVVRW